VQQTLQTEGIAGLFAGYPAKATQCVVQDLVFYFWFSRLRSAINAPPSNIPATMLVGAGAAALNILTTLPLEVVTTHMQTAMLAASPSARPAVESSSEEVSDTPDGQAGNSGAPCSDGNHSASTPTAPSATPRRGYISTLKYVATTFGIRGLWRGIVPSLILTSNPALQFAAFEAILSWLRARGVQGKTRAISPLVLFVVGAVAKALAIVVTFPLIRAKVVMMAHRHHMQPSEKSTQLHAPRPPRAGSPKGVSTSAATSAVFEQVGVRRVLNLILQREGIAGLYKGLGAQLSKTVVGAALVMVIKERLASRVKRFLASRVR